MSIPVYIISGFLGAGKTSFINRLLADHRRLKLGLVVNELGVAAIESSLVKLKTGGLFELSSGCLCCVAPSDLGSGISALKKESPGLDAILVEASGLTHPAPVIRSLLERGESWGVRFEGLITLVDTQSFFLHENEFLLVREQINLADFIILTKTDLVSPGQIKLIKNRLSEILPHTKVWDGGKSLNWSLLLGLKKTSLEHRYEGASFQENLATKIHGVESAIFTSVKPLEPRALGMILSQLPDSIIRSKGYLWVAHPSGDSWKYLFQYTGKQKFLTSRTWEKGEPPSSALVFFGKNLPLEKLLKDLAACEI